MAAEWSKTWSWMDGEWHEGNVPLYGVRTHASWLGSTVFDGARAFEGVTPDLDKHCRRTNNSARSLGLQPTMQAEEMLELVADGLSRFSKDAELYIRPLYWAEQGGYFSVPPLPESTRAAAEAMGRKRFDRFIGQVSDRLLGKESFTEEILARIDLVRSGEKPKLEAVS